MVVLPDQDSRLVCQGIHFGLAKQPTVHSGGDNRGRVCINWAATFSFSLSESIIYNLGDKYILNLNYVNF